MSFDIENGYSPRTEEDILSDLVDSVNFNYKTSYTPETFVGTNLHKLYYPGMQLIMGVENGLGSIAAKVQDYISYINKTIAYPKSSPNGIMNEIKNKWNVDASVMPINNVDDRGKCFIACDVDKSAAGYDELKQNIINTIGECVSAGCAFNGTETGIFVGNNGQNFQIAYEIPTEVNMTVKIVATVSRNSKDFIPIENVVSNLYQEKFKAAYRLGFDFEPDAYLCKDDLPWASNISVTYQVNGAGDFTGNVYKAAYNQKIVLTSVSTEIVDE